jgi:hypothetical protein
MVANKRPNIVVEERCTFCLSAIPRAESQARYGDIMEVRCPCCGTYRITGTMIDSLPHWDLTDARWAAIAYDLKKMTGRIEPPRLDRDALHALRATARLPHPDQILDDFVLWAGSQSRWPGDAFDITYERHRTLLGAVDENAHNYMIDYISKCGSFSGSSSVYSGSYAYQACSLTPPGWQRYRDLSSAKSARRYGFMAMKYGDEQLDAIVRDHFAPQVALTEFELKRLDDGQPAGLIDDQLRVRIRQARFLVCDLTHGNRGAYWEAGFAEGLGIPVIYTCRRDIFDDANDPCHPHFDAAHWVTVPWDPDDPALAATKLKATVRATLPAEARLED